MSIEEKVDLLIEGKKIAGVEKKQKKRVPLTYRIFGSRKSKFLSGIVGLAICLMLFSSAGLFSTFVTQEKEIVSEVLLLWDGVPAQDLEVTEVDSEHSSWTGGNTYQYNHWLNTSEYAQNNFTVDFLFSGDVVDDGITCDVLYLGNPVSNLTLSPDTDYQVQTRYICDEKLIAGNYSIILTVT